MKFAVLKSLLNDKSRKKLYSSKLFGGRLNAVKEFGFEKIIIRFINKLQKVVNSIYNILVFVFSLQKLVFNWK